MIRPRQTAVLLTLFLSGCGFFSSKPSRFFSLDRIAGDERRAIAGAPLALDVVELPPGLDRREVVVRKNDGQLEIRGREQWSAMLEPLVLHTLAFDLASRLPEGMVILPGQPIPSSPRRSIAVVLEELAAGPGNSVALDAHWSVRDGASLLSRQERIEVEIASLESAAVASGLSRALATLADRMSASLAAANTR